MTENKLEGFEDFDNLLDEAEGDAPAADAGGGDEADFAGELEDLLGDEGGEDISPAEAEDSDSELDSFFEDLSTIDDLEVLSEDEEEEAPAPAEPEEGGFDEMEVGAPEEAAPVAAPAAAPAREPRKPKEKKERGFFAKLIRWVILLAILLGGGYYVYLWFFPDAPPPWEVMEQEKEKLTSLLDERLQEPEPPPVAPPPPPPVTVAPPPKPAPAPPRKPAPPKEAGPWSIQVATCFFPSCLDSYRAYLKANDRSVIVREKTSRTEQLEIYSLSAFDTRELAQERADQVNREHPLEGHAYIYRDGAGYRLSMGAFADLERAKIVKDALNQQYLGNIVFATRVKAFPYKLQSVLTGRYPSRTAAQRALAKLKNAEPRFKDAFVLRRR